jgi:DNA polymerase-1
MTTVILYDIETEGLEGKKIHCIHAYAYDIDSDTVTSEFSTMLPSISHFKDWCGDLPMAAFNSTGFDYRVLCEHEPRFKDNPNWDIMIALKMEHYLTVPTHSLENWGIKIGYPKKKTPDFSWPNPKLLPYCRRDVDILLELSSKGYIDWSVFKSEAYITEEKFTREHPSLSCPFDINKAGRLLAEISLELSVLHDEFNKIPTKRVEDRRVKFRKNLDGSLNSTCLRIISNNNCRIEGEEIIIFKDVSFNPNSHKDRIDLLWDNDWQPVNRTATYNKRARSRTKVTKEEARYMWKVDEAGLNTLPSTASEAAKNLAKYMCLKSRQAMLIQYITAYNPTKKHIEANLWGIGAWTQRCAHNSPNLANIPSVPRGVPTTAVEEIKHKYDRGIRECFGVTDKRSFYGVDAMGIQLRILAYYMDDPDFIKEVLEGDIHEKNKSILGSVCKSRDDAKTFIYAWILGASPTKLAQILGCSVAEGKAAKDKFEKAWETGVTKVRAICSSAAKRGWFMAIDKRKVAVPSEHHALAGMLQSGEAIFMKNIINLLPAWVNVHLFVHDEIQFTVGGTATIVTHLFNGRAERVNEVLFPDFVDEYKRPLLEFSEVKEGKNWADTH